MTQDNAPPRPIFKARILHTAKRVSVLDRESLERSHPQLSETCRVVLESYLLRSHRALKISPGGVLTCVTHPPTWVLTECGAVAGLTCGAHGVSEVFPSSPNRTVPKPFRLPVFLSSQFPPSSALLSSAPPRTLALSETKAAGNAPIRDSRTNSRGVLERNRSRCSEVRNSFCQRQQAVACSMCLCI